MGKLNKNTGQMRDPPKDNLSSYLKKYKIDIQKWKPETTKKKGA
jgi:hypothetical protein